MRQKSGAVLCFTWSDASDALLPKIVRVHRDKYKRLSKILDANPAGLDGVAGNLCSLPQGGPRGGRGRKAVYTAENLVLSAGKTMSGCLARPRRSSPPTRGSTPKPPGGRPSPGLNLKRVLCAKHSRTVANDNTLRFEGSYYQLTPPRPVTTCPGRRSRYSNGSTVRSTSGIPSTAARHASPTVLLMCPLSRLSLPPWGAEGDRPPWSGPLQFWSLLAYSQDTRGDIVALARHSESGTLDLWPFGDIIRRSGSSLARCRSVG
jgi:hypothetical protein